MNNKHGYPVLGKNETDQLVVLIRKGIRKDILEFIEDYAPNNFRKYSLNQLKNYCLKVISYSRTTTIGNKTTEHNHHNKETEKTTEDTVNNETYHYGNLEEVKSELRGKILDTTKTVINGKRNDSYGNPENSFTAIADIWNWWINNKYISRNLPVVLTQEDSTMMMALMKIAREVNQHKKDNLVDLCGYIGLLGDMYDKE